MSKAFSSCTVDVLHIFGKAMCFFQNVGAVEAYNFSHTNVNFNPNFEKYLQGFISLLEELKVVLDRLYTENNKAISKSHEYSLSTEITNSNNYSVNLQSSGTTQNFTNIPTNATSQNYSHLQNNSVTQDFKKLKIISAQTYSSLPNNGTTQNFNEIQSGSVTQSFTKLKTNLSNHNYNELHNSGTQNFIGLQNSSTVQNFIKLNNNSSQHNFPELHSNNNDNNNAGTKVFTKLSNNTDVHSFSKLQSAAVSQNYADFKNKVTGHDFTEYKDGTSVQNFTKIQNDSNIPVYTKLQTSSVPQNFTGFKNTRIDDNFTGLQRDSSMMRQNFNDLPNSSNLLIGDSRNCAKTDNNDLLVTSSDLMTNNNQIEISNNELISNHDLNAITFTNGLITDNPSLVTNNDFNIDPNDKISHNQYIDNQSSGLTPGSQLISSAIESLVQESSNHDDVDDDPLNSEEITFRSLDVINQENNNGNCESSNINDSVWNEQQKDLSNLGGANNDVSKRKFSDKKNYACEVCNKTLSSKSSLAHHSSIHTGVKPFCCEHCGKLFTTSSNLAAHLTRQHNLNTESANSCPECGKLFVRKSALETHLAGHRGDKRFSCYTCGKKFTQKVTRDTHILTHTRTYPFSCNVCPRRFTSKSKLNFHKKKHGELQYSCSLCEKQFSNKQYLNAHYKTHNVAHAEAAPCCLDTVSENSRTQVLEVSHVTCPQCDLTFKTQRALTQHTKTKHNPLAPWYHCTVPDCNRPVKSFATRSQLRKHDKRHHSGLQRKKFTCSTCGKEFMEKYNLLHHERQNHTAGLTPQELRPFACDICPKRFTLKSKLNMHIRNHSQAIQFTCDVCAKVFDRKDTLKKHRLTQHPSLTTDQLQGVPNLLNAITCNRCGKMFKSKNSLMYHIQSHDGNYQYACSTCGKKFVRKCHYDDHVRTIHTTERPFKCSTCGRCFKNKKYWREHMRRVHTNEVTMQSLFDSITSEDALTTQHTFHVMHHVAQSQQAPSQPQAQSMVPPQPQTNCLPDVDVASSFVLTPASFEFQASSSVQ